jgi:hypothetical protein
MAVVDAAAGTGVSWDEKAVELIVPSATICKSHALSVESPTGVSKTHHR